MEVAGPRQPVGQAGQLQVVGGQQAETWSADECLDIGAAADQALAVVGAAEDLLDEVEQGLGGRGLECVEQALEALDFGIEVGEAVRQRVGDADAGVQA